VIENPANKLSLVPGIRIACGLLAIAVGLLCCLLGVAGIYDAAYSKGSGEWRGLGTLLVYLINIPGAVFVLILSLITNKKVLKIAGISLAIVALSLPFLVSYTVKVRDERYREKLERRYRVSILGTPYSNSLLSVNKQIIG
jgi:hypothetical protein